MMLSGRQRMAEFSELKSEAPVSSCTMASPSIMADLAPEARRGAGDRAIAVGPIISVASEDASLPSLKQHLAATAVMFDFVNPVRAFGRHVHGGRRLRLNETEPCGYAKHGGYFG